MKIKNLLNKEQKVDVCDATTVDSSTIAGNATPIFFFQKLFIR